MTTGATTDVSAGSTSTGDRTTAAALRNAIAAIEREPRLDGVARAMRSAARPVTEGPAGDVWTGRWLGHPLHPLLTDLPLGFWMSANVLDLVGGKKSRPAATRLVACGLLAVAPTALAGLADQQEIDDPARRRVTAVHATGNSAVAVAYLLSWRARHRGRHMRAVLWALTGGAMAVGTGYLGGHLAFAGDDSGSDTPTRAAGANSPGSAPAEGATVVSVEEHITALTFPTD